MVYTKNGGGNEANAKICITEPYVLITLGKIFLNF